MVDIDTWGKLWKVQAKRHDPIGQSIDSPGILAGRSKALSGVLAKMS